MSTLSYRFQTNLWNFDAGNCQIIQVNHVLLKNAKSKCFKYTIFEKSRNLSVAKYANLKIAKWTCPETFMQLGTIFWVWFIFLLFIRCFDLHLICVQQERLHSLQTEIHKRNRSWARGTRRWHASGRPTAVTNLTRVGWLNLGHLHIPRLFFLYFCILIYLSAAVEESFARALALLQTPKSNPSDMSDIYVKDLSQCKTVELAKRCQEVKCTPRSH